jgi:hypothetical protein
LISQVQEFLDFSRSDFTGLSRFFGRDIIHSNKKGRIKPVARNNKV